VVGDLDDPSALRAALGEVAAVFLVLSMMIGHRITLAGVQAERRRGRVVELAAAAEIPQLVYSSPSRPTNALHLNHEATPRRQRRQPDCGCESVRGNHRNQGDHHARSSPHR
jgi:hypothetical protein